MRNVMQLCDTFRETSFAIHRYLKHGHLEKVYENALAHRLRKAGVDVQQEHPLAVYDEDGTLIGDYYADLLVDTQLIVELKAAKTSASQEEIEEFSGVSTSATFCVSCAFSRPKGDLSSYEKRDIDRARRRPKH